MRNNYLASGPWVMSGKNTCKRVVCSQNENGIHVLSQEYDPSEPTGQQVCVGTYGSFTDICSALVQWEEVNAQFCQMPDDRPHTYAPPKMALAANLADDAETPE